MTHSPPPADVLLRYGKLRALAEHPRTPPAEATAARRRLERMAADHPGLSGEWEAFKARADQGARVPGGFDWDRLWRGDPEAMRILAQILQAHVQQLRAAAASSRSPVVGALDNLAAAGMDWLAASLRQEIEMGRGKEKGGREARNYEEVVELHVKMRVGSDGHVRITIDCTPEELTDYLTERNARRDFIDVIRSQLQELEDDEEDGDDEEEEEDDESSA